MDALRKRFPNVDDEVFETLRSAAARKMKALSPKKFTLASGGAFNAVALPVVPDEVTSVTDASKEPLEYRLVGQQIVASRPFVAPVAVEYITVHQRTKWQIDMETAICKEILKQ